VRLHVEIPALTLELTLAKVRSLLANLPRRAMKSPVALLRACYARLHGVDPATCSHAFSEQGFDQQGSESVVQPQALRRCRARWQERVGSGSEAAAPRAHTQRVCARVPPFRALVPQRRCPIRYEPAVRRPRRRLRAVHQRHARALPRARASPSTRTPPGVAHRPPPPPSPPPPSPDASAVLAADALAADALSAAVLALAVAALAAAAHAAAALAAAALDILISHRPIMYYDRPIRPFSLLRVGSRYV